MVSVVLISFATALALLGAAGAAFFPSFALTTPWLPHIVLAIAAANVLTTVILVAKLIRTESRSRNLTMNLETANIKLTDLDRMKSEFLSFASHQIKSPMSVVKGYATLILDGSYGPVSKPVAEIAEKIKQSADRMIGLVNTLLDLRRLDEGRISYQFEEIEVQPLVASVVEEMQQPATHKGLKLTLEPPAKSWRINADTQHLRQVIQNLVDNAIKYTDKGSVTVTLLEGPAGTVRIAVSDTGRGISPDLLPKLFEQFSRDQSIAKEIAGTGLGLYIAKQMITAHKGKIWATSPGPGKGSTFAVEIPHL